MFLKCFSGFLQIAVCLGGCQGLVMQLLRFLKGFLCVSKVFLLVFGTLLCVLGGCHGVAVQLLRFVYIFCVLLKCF